MSDYGSLTARHMPRVGRTKADVQLSYHREHRGGDRPPMLNVKIHAPFWGPLCEWEHSGHEFSGDAGFWTWLREMERNYDDPTIYREWDEACNDGWERAAEEADGQCDHPLWPGHSCGLASWCGNYDMTIYSAGRSGGWLVVDGLPPVESWDAVMLSRWWRFARDVQNIVDDTPYRFVWNLHEHVYAPIAERQAQEDADDAAAQLPVLVTA